MMPAWDDKDHAATHDAVMDDLQADWRWTACVKLVEQLQREYRLEYARRAEELGVIVHHVSMCEQLEVIWDKLHE